MDRMLDSTEAARLLGVKVSTLYVYVSRGLLESHHRPGTRRSYFAMGEVEQLGRRSHGGATFDTQIDTIMTSVTHLDERGPSYRGTPAIALTNQPFESVAEMLWQDSDCDWKPDYTAAPGQFSSRDTLTSVVLHCAGHDPLRSDRRPHAVTRAASRLISTMAASLTDHEITTNSAGESMATLIGFSMMNSHPPKEVIDAINAAMVLVADDELAISTLAVRIAASTRASLYDAINAGLAVMSGRLDDWETHLAWRLLEHSAEHGAESALNEALRWSTTLHGFGSKRYPAGDPRFFALKPYIDAAIPEADRANLQSLVEEAQRNELPGPTIDVAIAALVRSIGAEPAAAYVLRAIARTAGWVAHYLEELNEPKYRLEVRAVYVMPPFQDADLPARIAAV